MGLFANSFPSMTLFLIVGFLTIIQSIVGVGILLFGTPILLLMGYDFDAVLAILVPISLAISILTYLSERSSAANMDAGYLLFPALIFIGVVVSSNISIQQVKLFAGIILILSGSVRIFTKSKLDLANTLSGFKKRMGYYIVGFVHGLTNLGGGLLVILVTALSSDKNYCRKNISFYYGYMAMVQLISLYLINTKVLEEYLSLYLVMFSTAVFLLANIIFNKISSRQYLMISNILQVVIGMVLLSQSFVTR